MALNKEDNHDKNESEQENENHEITNSDMLTDDLDEEEEEEDVDVDNDDEDDDDETDDDDDETDDEDDENESEENSSEEEEEEDDGHRILRRSNSNVLLRKTPTTPLKSNGNNGNHLNGATSNLTPNGSGPKNGKLKKTRKENLLQQHQKEKMMSKSVVAASNKNKMGAIVRNRLCSLPGYNLLSENEKKVNKSNTNTNTSSSGFSYFNFKKEEEK